MCIATSMWYGYPIRVPRERERDAPRRLRACEAWVCHSFCPPPRPAPARVNPRGGVVSE